MVFDRRRLDVQMRGHFPIGHSPREQVEHLLLSDSQGDLCGVSSCGDRRLGGTTGIHDSVRTPALGFPAPTGGRSSQTSSGKLMQDATGDALIQSPLPRCDGSDRPQESVLISTFEKKARGTGLE